MLGVRLPSLTFLLASLASLAPLAVTSLALGGCTAPIVSDDASRAAAPGANGASAGETASAPVTSSMFVGVGHAPSALANDDTHVYWSEQASVFRASKAHPRAELLFGEGTSAVSTLVVDAAHVYAGDGTRGSLRAWSKKSGTLETLLPEGAAVSSLAQDADHVYAGMSVVTSSTTSATGAARAASAGRGGVAVIAKATHEAGGTLRPGTRVAKVAVWGSTLFTAEVEGAGGDEIRIVRSSTSGGEGLVVGVAASMPYELVVDGGVVYWVDARGLMASTAPAPLHVAPAGGVLAGSLSVIDGVAYVTELAEPGTSDGKVVRVPVTGGSPSVVAILAAGAPAGAYRASGLLQTFDRTSFYTTTTWTSPAGTERGDAIVKLPLPGTVL